MILDYMYYRLFRLAFYYYTVFISYYYYDRLFPQSSISNSH